ncbi:MAG TPA: hypothetical protein EYG89_00440 [Bacteroidia bacterium]|nr:hypothetical protein [Arcobacter sp.]HIP33217.1 hypothetical protein [Bacteroidia bacterium]
MIDLLILAIKETILYVLVSYGIYVSFKVLKFPDLSIDNVFSFGAIAGVFFYTYTQNILISTIILILASIILGGITSSLHSYFKISKLFSGILVFTMLYSVNLKFFHKPNIPIDIDINIFNVLLISLLFIFILFLLNKTFLGKLMIVYGDNKNLLKELSINKNFILFIGLSLSTTLVTISGFYTALYFGFADISLGFGVLISGVAGILLGDIIGNKLGLKNDYLNILIGVIIYNTILSIVSFYFLNTYIEASDLKMVSSLILITILYINNKNSKDLFGI